MQSETAHAETTKKICLYQTPCRNCCFAAYDGDTQVGCKFGMIDKFRKAGIEVKEARDDEKEFFVIGSACMLNRDRRSPWAMRTPGRDRMASARGEVALKVDVVVLMSGADTVDGLHATFESLLAQTHPPANVRVPVNRDGVAPREVRAVMPGDWICQFIMERTADGGRIADSRCVDHAVHGSDSDFYVSVRAGLVLPPDFLASLDRSINDDVERFVLLEPTEDWPCEVVQMRAHRYYGGNCEAVVEGDDAGPESGTHADSIGDKIRHRARVEGMGHLVKKVTDVWHGNTSSTASAAPAPAATPSSASTTTGTSP